jgi:hypothetical protein
MLYLADDMKYTLHSNTYYKVGENLTSGCPLPTDDNGIVKDGIFLQCDFHPNCRLVKIENCIFIDCYGHNGLWTENCTTHKSV